MKCPNTRLYENIGSFWYIDTNFTTKHSVIKEGYLPNRHQKELILAGNWFENREDAMRTAWIFKVVLSKGKEKIVNEDNKVIYGVKVRTRKTDEAGINRNHS